MTPKAVLSDACAVKRRRAALDTNPMEGRKVSGMIPIREAEARTGKSWWALRRRVASGAVAAVRIDGRIYVSEADVQRILAPVPITPSSVITTPRPAA